MDEKSGKPATIDEYISQQPEDVQQILVKIRAVIQASAPGAVEKFSYQMPAFTLNGVLIWFGAFRHHIGIYPKTSAMLEQIKELSDYRGTKGSVHFPLDRPIPYELIAKIVKVRAVENMKSKSSEKH